MSTVAKDPYAESRERFEQETAKHEMTVLHDDGLYRHLRFKEPGSGFYWYDLITWPGYLAIVGDAGDFVFTRVRDMFEFFKPEYAYGINPDYWSQKLQAPRHDAAKTYSYDVYRRRVQEWRDDQIRDGGLEREEADRLVGAVREQLLDDWLGVRDSEYAAHEALRDFEFDGRRIEDSWEWHLREWDWQFLWCCWAIVRGIETYRAHTPGPEGKGP